MAAICGHILTETEDRILTESEDALVTECFTSALVPGRVYRGEYPYWKPRRKPYWEAELDPEEEEFILLCIALGIFRLI